MSSPASAPPFLFVVPRALQRFAIPAAITSLALGAAAGLGFGLFQHDTTLHLLSAFGIVALFLFAGLEVDTRDLRGNAGVLLQHLGGRTVLLAMVAYAPTRLLHLEGRAATLLALALLRVAGAPATTMWSTAAQLSKQGRGRGSLGPRGDDPDPAEDDQREGPVAKAQVRESSSRPRSLPRGDPSARSSRNAPGASRGPGGSCGRTCVFASRIAWYAGDRISTPARLNASWISACRS